MIACVVVIHFCWIAELPSQVLNLKDFVRERGLSREVIEDVRFFTDRPSLFGEFWLLGSVLALR
jgi:hypothetical protein